MVLEIAFGVLDNQKYRVAEIIYNTFENKFDTIFGSKKAILLITRHIRDDRTIIAVSKGVVIGVAGCEFASKEFFDVSFWQLLRELRFGIFRVLFYGWLFHNKVEEKELLIDILAVANNMRGKGIGSKLVSFIIDFASSKGYEQVKLFVTNTNEKAKRLYKRLGFQEENTHNVPFPWSKIFSFNKIIKMTYEI
jgi:GNAT superfamily N-acetyltransferase